MVQQVSHQYQMMDVWIRASTKNQVCESICFWTGVYPVPCWPRPRHVGSWRSAPLVLAASPGLTQKTVPLLAPVLLLGVFEILFSWAFRLLGFWVPFSTSWEVPLPLGFWVPSSISWEVLLLLESYFPSCWISLGVVGPPKSLPMQRCSYSVRRALGPSWRVLAALRQVPVQAHLLPLLPRV